MVPATLRNQKIAALPPTGALRGATSGNAQTLTLALDSQSLGATVQGPGQANSGAASAPTLPPQPVPALVLPNSSLFRIDPGSNARYVVETDPRFASYRQWLSSDYMLSALGADPALIEKRLGDGFYEQRLIREQVAALTGYRFLGDYRSDEQQYRALMNAGATLAKAQQLRPGIALSAQQVAQLTSDVVWLVSRTVQLPDGTTTTALVPQVYLAPRPGDLDASGALFGGAQATGALISASDISLALQSTLSNSGTIAGRRLLNIGAGDIRNSGLVQGDAVLLNARQDLSIDGGRVAAVTGLAARADGALSITSTTAQGAGAAGNGVFASRQLDRVAGLYVSGPAGSLLASAGGAFTLTAAQIRNAGTGITQLQSDGSLTLDTVRLTSSLDVTHDSRNYARVNTSQDAGSDISAAGALTLLSRGDMVLRAARLQAADALDLSATQGSIAIQAGQSSFDMQTASYSRSRGGFLGLGSSSTTQRSSTSLTTAVASELGGARIAIGAGQGLEITASNVLADREVSLGAAGDITLRAGQNTRSESSFSATSRSGLFSGGGLSLTLGRQQFSLDQQASFTTAAPVTVGSLAGDVTIRAGGAYTQVGSHLLAPGGDIAIEAQRVDILEARETSRQQTETRSRQSGLTLALTNPVVNAVQTAQQMGAAAADTRDGRMQALAAASTALAARDGAQAFRANPGQVGGINLSISLGGSQSSSASLQTSDRAAGSTVAAGGDIDIRATGAGGESVILIQGSHVRAERSLRLEAEQQVQLLAARNTAGQSGSQSSKSGSLGITVGTSGLGYTASASGGRGSSEGSDLAYTNSHLDAGGQVFLRSGSDTTLRGAVVQAPRIIFDVGGQLTIQSLQDTSTYASRHSSTGGSLTVGATPNASLSLSRGRVDSGFTSVIEQSGLVAGDGGFTVQVAGNTSLVAGIISSSERAVQDGLNRLTTGTLTIADLQNSASASAGARAIGLSSELLRQGKYGETKAVLTNVLTTSKEAAETGGATRAAVSGGMVDITNDAAQRAATGQSATQAVAALNRDSAGAHTAADRPAAEAVERAVQASLAIKQEAVTQVTMLTDEAYRSRFLITPTLLMGICPQGANCETDRGKLVFRRATPEELAQAEAGAVLAVNGIFNDERRAVELAYQNLEPDNQSKDKPHTFFVMHIAPAGNAISELLGVAYEKVVASSDYGLANFLGYTNGHDMYADLLRSRGNQATLSLGHSRGTLVQEAAFTIATNRPDGDGNTYSNPNLSVRGVGGAANVGAYTDKAINIVGEKDKGNITFNYFSTDPVAVLAGRNPGVTTLSDIWKVFTTSNSMHSCYGTGATGCTEVEIPIPGVNPGTPEGNAKLIRFKGGVQVDAQGNPIAPATRETRK